MPTRMTRRSFLRDGAAGIGGFVFPATNPRDGAAREAWVRPGGLVPAGEWWAGGGPRDALPTSTIVQPDEPGERLILRGTVYGADGRTPLPGVTVYVYQTDARGLYNPEGKFGVPHRIRGWVNTDDHGRYEFRTIKPGHYPNRTTPAHIHMTVSRMDIPEWWLPEVWFEGDHLITPAQYRTASSDGRFSNIRPLVMRGGSLLCTRDLRL